MDLSFGCASDVGAVRELNEDSVLAAPNVFVVADGMGGHAAGEVASALAVDHLARLANRPELHPDDVIAALNHANAAILAHVTEHPETAGMGTTAAGLCLGIHEGAAHWIVFNIGDSRVYRFADSRLSQVTIDHSRVEEMVAVGQITAEQARTHPLRNIITRSLGTEPAPVVDVWTLPATDGDWFLVCSDGLTTELSNDDIAEVLASGGQPQNLAEALVQRAVAAGGRDNVSVIVVETLGDPSSEPVDPASR